MKNPDDASRRYVLGAQLLNFLAPDSGQKTLVVPIATAVTERKVTAGVLDRDILADQTKAALELLRVNNPDRIVTPRQGLFGQCGAVHLSGREIR